MTSHNPEDARPFNLESLTAPVSSIEVKEHARQLEHDAGIRARPPWFNVGCVLVIVLVIGIPTTVLFGLLATEHGIIWGILAAVIAIATAAICVLVITAAARQGTREPERRFRLRRFADDNGLNYLPQVLAPGYSGRIFERGQERTAHDVIRRTDDSFEAANYSYVTIGYRGARSVWTWGYITAPTTNSTPPLLLDAKSNNSAFDDGVTNAFEALIPTELSTPAGDRFTLWARPGDVKAANALIDEALLTQLAKRPADLEIVDGRMFLYIHGSLSTSDPDMWTWAMDTVRAVQSRSAEPS